MPTPKKPKVTKADLQRKVAELEAQLAHTYHFADVELDKAGLAKMTGSGVVLSLTALGGREIISPVCIRDGLSDETIDAIRNDIKRSWNLTVQLKPKGV